MHVLLLENHPLFADALKQVVLRLAAQVVVCIIDDHPALALQLVETSKSFDLILVGCNPPDDNGLHFMRLLHDQRVSAPIIIVSSSNDPEHLQLCFEKGIMGYIHKSSDVKTILGALHQVLSGQCYYSSIDYTEKINVNKKTNRDSIKLEITDRQLNVLQLLGEGHSNKSVARTLNITESTVKSHVSHLMNTFSVSNRTGCVLEAQRLGLL